MTLLPSDSEGLALWNQIAPGVPNIAPKGTINGSTINEMYDIVDDPDCCESHLFVTSSAILGGGRRRVATEGEFPRGSHRRRAFPQWTLTSFAQRHPKPGLHLLFHR